jgi:acyl carrier protein
MKNGPEFQTIVDKVIAIIEAVVDTEAELRPTAPLMKELGFDSLDLIETSFSLEEFFGFEFNSKNPIEELNDALGGEAIVVQGKLTALGRDMVLRRMPELTGVDLPAELSVMELQQYFSIETFARLIAEFYDAAPDTCPETGEPVVVKDFKIVTESGGQPVRVPSGDELVDRWVATMTAMLKASTT